MRFSVFSLSSHFLYLPPNLTNEDAKNRVAINAVVQVSYLTNALPTIDRSKKTIYFNFRSCFHENKPFTITPVVLPLFYLFPLNRSRIFLNLVFAHKLLFPGIYVINFFKCSDHSSSLCLSLIVSSLSLITRKDKTWLKFHLFVEINRLWSSFLSNELITDKNIVTERKVR